MTASQSELSKLHSKLKVDVFMKNKLQCCKSKNGKKCF